jgi:hypothetical protein
MQWVMNGLEALHRIGRNAGFYLVLELLLPGGTLVALLLFLYRRGKLDPRGFASRAVATVSRRFAGAFEGGTPVPGPCYVRVAQDRIHGGSRRGGASR